MKHIDLSNELINFINKSASMFHSIDTVQSYLDKEDFIELNEGETWNIEKGKNYYTTRNGSSIIAFKVGNNLENLHYQISAAHSDSPTYKVKSVPELKGPGEYLKINIEGYGGMIDSSWFDRPLGLAGRVLVDNGGKVESRLFNIDKDILIIPNVAIHFNRKINDGYKYNKQVDLIPLFSAGKLKKGAYNEMIAKELEVDADDILAKDLYLVNRQEGKVWGYDDEFISSPKLDNLQSTFIGLKAFIEGNNDKSINVYASFDNEEVGSNTKQGALSTFLKDTLKRINGSLGFNEEDYYKSIAKSFMISCDNAHAVHPNHPEMTDDENKAFMNKGVVIKESANQKYTSDAFSQGIFKKICKEADVPVQHFSNRSDAQGGSTLGNLSNIQVSLHQVDIGLAQLAMHSSYETGGSMDTLYGIKALTKFYNSNILIDGANKFEIE